MEERRGREEIESETGERLDKRLAEKKRYYRKTPLISMYVISGLAMVQVYLFSGAILTFVGYDKAGAKILQGRSLSNPVLSVDNALLCMFQ